MRKDEEFDLRKEMKAYCRCDVDILRQACLTFRELLMGATGQQAEIINEKNKKERQWVGAMDPFDSVTIASVCMNLFRTKFIEEEWIVKLEGRCTWIPATSIDQKLYLIWQNKMDP